MVTVTETELDELTSASGSIHQSFFGISIGALTAFWTTLATVPITDAKTYAMFVALAVVSGGATVFFGGSSVMDYVRKRRRLKQMKSGLV